MLREGRAGRSWPLTRAKSIVVSHYLTATVITAATFLVIVMVGWWFPCAAAAIAGALLLGVYLGRLLRSKSAPNDFLSAAIPRESAAPEPAKRSSNAAGAPAEIFEATMDGMREGVLVIDETTRVVAANRKAQEIFVGAPKPLEARRLSEVTRHPAIHAAFLDALDGRTPAEAKIELPGEERRIFSLRVVPLHTGPEKKCTAALGVFFDVTKLEHLERVRQEFLSNVSHELRTPLTAILAFVETLEDGAVDDPASNRQFLSVIRRNAERMHSLIDDILELSAIETGTVAIDLSDVRLSAAVTDIITALMTRASARNVELRNEVDAEAKVFADPRRLEQMLTNLLDNAIKFNREGGTVTISHERGDRDRISVTDTGEGIPSEHLPRLFERFYRVDRARSRELGGTGLGLAIVKHLAKAHGGDVRAESVPNQGSTFIIELPTAAKQNAEELSRNP